MDDEDAVASLEERQKRIERELKKRRQAATRARKEEEERQLIAAGEGKRGGLNTQTTHYLRATVTPPLGPRRAKAKALKEAGKSSSPVTGLTRILVTVC
jgi:septal ring factor EnvC (AmiA/AmiB activator)